MSYSASQGLSQSQADLETQARAEAEARWIMAFQVCAHSATARGETDGDTRVRCFPEADELAGRDNRPYP